MAVDGYHTWVSWLYEGDPGVTHVDDFQYENFVDRDCKINAGDMREVLSCIVALVLRRLGGVL